MMGVEPVARSPIMSVVRKCERCGSEMPVVEKTADNFEIPSQCPGCGEKTPKRDGGPREKKVTTAHITFEGKKKEFVTVDISRDGVKAFYLGRPLPVDAVVDVDVGATGQVIRKAIVKWSNKSAPAYSHSGLKFI